MLDVLAQVDVGQDENISPGSGVPGADPRYRLSGTYVGSSLRVAWDRRRSRVDVSSFGEGQFRRYDTESPFSARDLRAGLGLRLALSRSTTLSLNQVANWAPYFQLDLLPGLFAPGLGEGPEMAFDFALNATEMQRLSSAVSLLQRVGRRGSLTVTGDYIDTSYDDARYTDTGTRAGGVTYRHELSRYTAIRLGYRRTRAVYTSGRILERDDIISGVDYRRQLSFSRRTSFAISSGSTLWRTTTGSTRFRVLGNAALQHEMGRSWSATLNYARNVALIDGFSEPIAYDSLRGQLRGYLSRRTLFSASLGISRGAETLAASGDYQLIIGDVMGQFALTSMLAAYAEYAQFRYDYDAEFLAALPAGSRLNRRSIRAGLLLWLPILR